ncbi:MAG: rhodanese-like domain-containing protein [Candidatus Obscuribacterales bacterium]|nr:rhodanese-like domain-containing protein [Candidatus Obscuribacterales bacterium]
MSEKTISAACPSVKAIDVKKGEQILIDVRSPIEFETEHIEGSINVPLELIDTKHEEIPRKGKLVIICRSGKRAERAAYTLLGHGFQPGVLEGGILSWKKAGLALIEGRKRISIERQIQLIVGLGVLTGLSLGFVLNPYFFLIPAFFGAGLTFAGLTGTCALGILLGKAPWNQLELTDKSNQNKKSCCS